MGKWKEVDDKEINKAVNAERGWHSCWWYYKGGWWVLDFEANRDICEKADMEAAEEEITKTGDTDEHDGIDVQDDRDICENVKDELNKITKHKSMTEKIELLFRKFKTWTLW